MFSNRGGFDGPTREEILAAERKRQQYVQELAEQVRQKKEREAREREANERADARIDYAYNPFGRAGGGAPRASRLEAQHHPQQHHSPAPVPGSYGGPPVQQSNYSGPAFAFGANGRDRITAQPRDMSALERQQQYRRELEEQMRADAARKERERSKLSEWERKQEAQNGYWDNAGNRNNNRGGARNSQPPPTQQHQQQHQLPPSSGAYGGTQLPPIHPSGGGGGDYQSYERPPVSENLVPTANHEHLRIEGGAFFTGGLAHVPVGVEFRPEFTTGGEPAVQELLREYARKISSKPPSLDAPSSPVAKLLNKPPPPRDDSGDRWYSLRREMEREQEELRERIAKNRSITDQVQIQIKNNQVHLAKIQQEMLVAQKGQELPHHVENQAAPLAPSPPPDMDPPPKDILERIDQGAKKLAIDAHNNRDAALMYDAGTVATRQDSNQQDDDRPQSPIRYPFSARNKGKQRPSDQGQHFSNPHDERPVGGSARPSHTNPHDERPIGGSARPSHNPHDERPVGGGGMSHRQQKGVKLII